MDENKQNESANLTKENGMCYSENGENIGHGNSVPAPSKEEWEATQRKVGDQEEGEGNEEHKNGKLCKTSTIVFLVIGCTIFVALLVTLVYFTVVFTNEKKTDVMKTTGQTENPDLLQSALKQTTSNGLDDIMKSLPRYPKNAKTDDASITNTVPNRGPNPRSMTRRTVMPNEVTTTQLRTIPQGMRAAPRGSRSTRPQPSPDAITITTENTPAENPVKGFKPLRRLLPPKQYSSEPVTFTTAKIITEKSNTTPRSNIKAFRGRLRPPKPAQQQNDESEPTGNQMIVNTTPQDTPGDSAADEGNAKTPQESSCVQAQCESPNGDSNSQDPEKVSINQVGE